MKALWWTIEGTLTEPALGFVSCVVCISSSQYNSGPFRLKMSVFRAWELHDGAERWKVSGRDVVMIYEMEQGLCAGWVWGRCIIVMHGSAQRRHSAAGKQPPLHCLSTALRQPQRQASRHLVNDSLPSTVSFHEHPEAHQPSKTREKNWNMSSHLLHWF